jgi:hypothetical protein
VDEKIEDLINQKGFSRIPKKFTGTLSVQRKFGENENQGKLTLNSILDGSSRRPAQPKVNNSRGKRL